MDNNDTVPQPRTLPSTTYALSGRIMLSAIVILFGIVMFMACLHIYARWYLLRTRRRVARNRARRRTHLVFYVDTGNPTAVSGVSGFRGLDPSVLESLPVFIYSSKDHPEGLECAVCLSDFEQGEKGRIMPKCSHSFHIDCIDMWFHSHSTCPLCRSPVESVPETLNEVVVTVVDEPDRNRTDVVTDSISDLCSSTFVHDETDPPMASSSLSDRRKTIELSINVSRSNELEEEVGTSSPASQGFKSPASRLRSFRRMLSMNRKGSVGNEADVERGSDESTHQLIVSQTPR
ncbi:RING-H2 finger protein ATL2 [Impatiens glandulifera]|uniref:RING-H2 finger protein ATL2 n=1 Tax=Impatiens glandulifera TaxID=253017 RepID=UPI001FB09738|nr:RING-H2 finger protein ATL2 [Impatiens glandulifera]